MNEELKPCAHCGCVHINEWHDQVPGVPHHAIAFLYCLVCGMRTIGLMHHQNISFSYQETMQNLKNIWNKRVQYNFTVVDSSCDPQYSLLGAFASKEEAEAFINELCQDEGLPPYRDNLIIVG